MEDTMNHESYKNLLNVFETLTRAQLNAIRQLKKNAGLIETEKPKAKSISQIGMVYDILYNNKKSMHVNDIIAAAKRKFEIDIDKDSLVSALTKRVKRQDRFIKTGPNTFDLINPDEGGKQ
jgi:hypothetical protein